MNDIEKTIQDLLKTIGDATDGFNASIDPVQQTIYRDIENVVRGLDIKGNALQNTVKNIRAIGELKNKIQKIILNKQYVNNVKGFISIFNDVADIQENYYSQLSENVGSAKLLQAVKEQSINNTVTSLTESGISVNVTEGIQAILKRNITGGGNYNDLLDQMRNFILTNETGTGALAKYTKQITTDSLNQFSAQYAQVLSSGLANDWYMYVGSNKTTTREFCRLLTQKKYVHKSELADIINGIIDGVQVKINPKTKIWYGGIPGTNEDNFQVVRGGYGCDHQFLSVNEKVVPQAIRERFAA